MNEESLLELIGSNTYGLIASWWSVKTVEKQHLLRRPWNTKFGKRLHRTEITEGVGERQILH